MAVSVMMPRQGQSVETCVIGEWHKQVGDQVEAGEILFSYETDKASFEEEAKEDGELLAIFFSEGDEVPVLANVAVIGKKGESVDEFCPDSGSAQVEGKINTSSLADETNTLSDETDPAEKGGKAVPVDKQGRKIKISPLAKAIAKKSGISYEQVQGSGPYGRIISKDIAAAAESSSQMKPLSMGQENSEDLAFGQEKTASETGISIGIPTPFNPVYSEDFEVKKLSNIRKLIAKAMLQSLQNSAQLTHHMSADARNILSVRKQLKEDFEAGKKAENVTINDLVCFAVIKALKKWPQVNTHFLSDNMRWFKKIHLGIAVDTERGLMVPVVKNADDLSLEGLSAQINSIVVQCRQGSINPELLSPQAATFTVSNLGNYGVEMFTPVVNLPQSAILGVCTIMPRPKDMGSGVFGFVPMMGLSLTYDHQALDGGEASLFLREIKEQIENIKTNYHKEKS